MMNEEIVAGVLLDDATLTCDELAHACAVSLEWVSLHVQAGILSTCGEAPAEWRFTGAELRRARRLRTLERDFDALPELAALVIDLQDEIARLRAQLRRPG